MRGVDVYLEIGRAVAVYIAPEEMTGVSEFSRHAMKAFCADEVKGLIEPGNCVGVDIMEVDLVVLQMIEVGDHVATGANGAFDRAVEHEFVVRAAASQSVLVEAANQHVPKRTSFQDIIACFAGNLTGHLPAFHDVIDLNEVGEAIVAGAEIHIAKQRAGILDLLDPSKSSDCSRGVD